MGQIMYFWQNPNPRYDWTKMKDLSGQGIHYIPLLLADIGSTQLDGIGSILSFYGFYNWSGGTFAQYGAGPFSFIQNANETFADDYYAPFVFGKFGFTSASRTDPLTAQMTNPINGVSYGNLLASEIMTYRRPCMITATTGQTNLFLGLLYTPYFNFHTWVCEGDQQWVTTTTQTITYYYYVGTDPALHTNQTVSTSTTYTDYLYMNWGWGTKYSSDNGFFYNSQVNYTQPYSNAYPNGPIPDPKKYTPFMDFQTIVYNIHR